MPVPWYANFIVAQAFFSLAKKVSLFKERQRGSMTDERGQQIEEQARRNHGAVIQELKDKFRNYKENCFPMPKGCRCVERGPKGEDIVKRIHVEAECRMPQSARTGGS